MAKGNLGIEERFAINIDCSKIYKIQWMPLDYIFIYHIFCFYLCNAPASFFGEMTPELTPDSSYPHRRIIIFHPLTNNHDNVNSVESRDVRRNISTSQSSLDSVTRTSLLPVFERFCLSAYLAITSA